MGQIVVTEFVSLDGVMENPGWTFPYWNDEVRDFKAEESAAADALLLGRVTYEGFAAAWPNSTDEGAEKINGMPKYVVTNTLTELAWNNSHAVSGDVVAGLRALRQQEGLSLLVYGSAMLVNTLIEHDLVDSLRLPVYPVVLGSGKRTFSDGVAAKFRLAESRTTSSGVVGLVYEPLRG